MYSANYQVKTEVFEGPLDLLLHLIKKNEVDICDIPVSKITDQYLSYLQAMREMNLDIAGEYLVMAATLAYIKSCMLLPPSGDEEEEGSAESLRQQLVEQLLAHQQFKEAAAALADRDILSRDVFAREPRETQTTDGPLTLKEVSVTDLARAFQRLIESKLRESFHAIVTEEVSVKDCSRSIRERLAAVDRVRFVELFAPLATRLHWVATLIAVLELIKEGFLVARQDIAFGDIWLIRR